MGKNTQRRLLVTGHDEQGRSCVVSDTLIEGNEVPGRPGMELNMVWGGDEVMRYPDAGKKPAYVNFFPPINGFRMLEMYMPGKTFNAPEEKEEAGSLDDITTGQSVVNDRKRPGMHRSATLDMGYMIEGRIVLELDIGEVVLNAGDVIIQSGAMHAWHNPFDEPARFIGVMVGTHMDEDKFA